MTVKRFSAALSLVAVSILSARAEIPMSEVYQVAVPDSLHVKGYQGLVDVDDDGFGDLCFRSSSQVSAYSIVKDEPIAFLQIEADGNQRMFDGGFVDDDNLFDFAEAVFVGDSSRQTLHVVTRYGADGHVPLDTVEVASYTDGYIRAIDSLFLRDVDGDGREELFGRHVYGVFIPDWDSYTDTGYYEYYYQAFGYDPELREFELLDEIPANLKLRYKVDGTNDLAAVWIENYRYYVPMSHGIGSQEEVWFALLAAKNDSSIVKRSFFNWYGAGCVPTDAGASSYDGATLSGWVVGDLLTSSPGWEAVLVIDYNAWVGFAYTGCSKSFKRLVYLDLSSPDSLALVDEVIPYEGFDIGPGFADEAYPNKFFTLTDGRFHLVDAETLTRTDSSAALFSGKRYVDYASIGPDGPELALFRDGFTFHLYSLDVATDVPDPESSSLPVSFELRQPYPNPFNAELTVPIELSRNGRLRVAVFDVLGRQVETLYDDYASKGKMSLPWEAEDFASGVYLIKATSGSSVQTAKVVLLK